MTFELSLWPASSASTQRSCPATDALSAYAASTPATVSENVTTAGGMGLCDGVCDGVAPSDSVAVDVGVGVEENPVCVEVSDAVDVVLGEMSADALALPVEVSDACGGTDGPAAAVAAAELLEVPVGTDEADGAPKAVALAVGASDAPAEGE